MSDAMVTARMSVAKKEAGVRALRSLGMTASEAINAMFDYLINNGSLPFGLRVCFALASSEWLNRSDSWMHSKG